MKSLLTFLFSVLFLFAKAGGGNETTGATAIGLAGAGITQRNVWSATNNVGALGAVDEFAIGVAYENRFGLSNVGLKTLVATLPTAGGTFGFAAHQFGFSSYQENRVGLGYGKRLSEHVSLGAQINYVGFRLGDVYGSRNTLTAAIGMLIQPKKNVHFAVLVYNPTRAKLADFNDERVPSTLSLSGQYDFSEKASGIVQVDKSINQPLNIMTALQYKPIQDVTIRAGYASAQSSMSFGFGYFWKKLNIDAAAKWHQTLGFSTTISMSYELGKRKKKQ